MWKFRSKKRNFARLESIKLFSKMREQFFFCLVPFSFFFCSFLKIKTPLISWGIFATGLNRGVKNVQLWVVRHNSDVLFLEKIITLHYDSYNLNGRWESFFFPFPKGTVFCEDFSYRFPQAICQNSLLMCEKVEVLRQ